MTVTIENTYTGNGSATDYSFTFPYLDTTDIKASLGGVVTTAFALTNATTVRFNSAPGNGVAIRIYRETAYENPKATFYPGSAIRAGDLNDNTLQNLYVTQEANDKVANSWQTGDPTIISTETWHTSDDTKIATTKAIENRINSQIDSALTDDVVAGSSITIADNTPSAGKITVSVPAASGSAAGTMSASDFSKLAGIDTGAKDDQTAAEIRALVESATDSNVFTDADHSKLNGIDTGAKDDQTAAEIRALVESATDSNVFTDTDHSRLNAMEDNATADQTAAEIKTAYESNAQTNALTDAEKLVIDGVTANTSELNKLDGVTASTTELNIVAGKSFKTSSGTLDTTSDTEIPSSKVIAAHVASSQTAIGGFITIADEVSFPTTANMPANGVVVSINNAAGVVVNGSGVSTTGRTTDGTPATVTINNFPSSLNGETLSAGVGLIVTATSTSNTYNYHKILVAESDVKQLSDDINDFNSRYRIASSAPGSNNDEGDLYFDTGANKMKVYNGSSWDDVASVGSFFINTISSSSGTGGGSATFNGSAYRFTLSNAGTAAQQHIVSVNGVIQKPNSGTSQPSEGFAIDGSDIIFSAAPASGADYFIITQGSSVSIGTPSANSVNSSHIIDGSITNADISNSAAIAQSKIAIGGANGLDFSDGTIVKFGTDSDMYIYHENTSHTTRFHAYNDRVIDIGYNQTSSGLKKSFIQCYPNSGQVYLYHGGTSKFSTTATGINVTGDVVLSENIELGNDKNINLGTAFSARHFTSDPSGSGWITGDQNAFYSNTAKPFRFYNYISGSTTWQPHISMNPSGNVELFHSGSKKLETTSGGVDVTGALTVNGAELSSAPTITATADGAIAANKPCVLRSDGKVSQAAFETSSESAGFNVGKTSFITSYGSASAANDEDSNSHQYSMDYDTVNKKLLKVINKTTDGGSNYDFCVYVGTVTGNGNGTTTTWTEHVVDAGQWIGTPICKYNPAKKKFLIGGANHTDSKVQFWHVTLDSNGTPTISDKLDIEWAGSSTYWDIGNWVAGQTFIPVYDSEYEVITVFGGDQSVSTMSGLLRFIVINNATDTPTSNPEAQATYVSSRGMNSVYGFGVDYDTTNKMYLVYLNGRLRQGWSGQTYTRGYYSYHLNVLDWTNLGTLDWLEPDNDILSTSTSTFDDDHHFYVKYLPAKGAFLVRYTDLPTSNISNDVRAQARVVTLDSSGNITKGTELTYTHIDDDGNGGAREGSNSIFIVKDSSNNEHYYQIGYKSDDLDGSNSPFIQEFTITGTGSSAAVSVAYNAISWTSGGASTTWRSPVASAAVVAEGAVVLTDHDYSGNSNNALMHQAGCLWFNGSNVSDGSFVGFSDAAYSDTATATINVVGNTTTQSGLSPGTNYYVSSTGTLTTTSTENPYAGKALTATSLLIKG